LQLPFSRLRWQRLIILSVRRISYPEIKVTQFFSREQSELTWTFFSYIFYKDLFIIQLPLCIYFHAVWFPFWCNFARDAELLRRGSAAVTLIKPSGSVSMPSLLQRERYFPDLLSIIAPRARLFFYDYIITSYWSRFLF
jgi:hypothetical protein